MADLDRAFLEEKIHPLAIRGSEIDYSLLVLDRALELLDLTIADPRYSRLLRELARLRETLVDYFMGDSQFGSTDKMDKNFLFRPELGACSESS